MKIYFPDLVRANFFIPNLPLYFLKFQSMPNHSYGIVFVDSTKLLVCANSRIYSHKVFKGFKDSVGWFYGFKLHLIVNETHQRSYQI